MFKSRVALPLAGGCQCGVRRYRVNAAPLTLYCCHCTECQAQSSSAFGMSMLVERSAIEVDWAGLATWTRRTDGGNTLDCHFCPDCGTRLFHVGRESPEIISLKAGSLDDHSWFQPAGHIWTDSAQPWFRIPEDAFTTPRDPDDMAPFMDRWSKQTTGWFV